MPPTLRAIRAAPPLALVAGGLAIISGAVLALNEFVAHASATSCWLYMLVVLPVTLRWGRIAGLAATLASTVLVLLLAARPLLLPYSSDVGDFVRIAISVAGMAAVVEVVDRVNRARIEGERRSAVAERDAGAAILRDVVVSQLTDGLVVAGQQGRIAWANPIADELYGGLVLGETGEDQPGFQLFYPDGRPCTPDELPIARAVRGGETVPRSDYVVRRQDGVELIVETRAAPVTGADGTRFGAVLSVRDVTAERELVREKDAALGREQAARAAAETAVEQIRAIQAVSDAALAAPSLDTLLDTVLHHIQSAMEADEATILLPTAGGQELAIHMIVGVDREVVRDVRVPIGQGFAGRVLETRAPTIVDDVPTSQVINPYLRENIRSLAGVPLIADGRAIGVLHIGTATERRFDEDDIRLLQLVADRVALAIDRARLHEAERQAGAEAMAARARLDAVLRQLPVGVVIAEAPTGRIVMSNDHVGEILGHPLADGLSVEDIGFWVGRRPDGAPIEPGESPLARVIRSGETIVDEEVPYERGDGTLGYLRVSAAPVRDADDRITAAVTAFHDVTGQKQLDEARVRLLEQEQAARTEAEVANRAKDEFLSVLSHELRTPLTAILAWTDLVGRPGVELRTLAQGLDVIRRNARAQARLIGDLLDVSRIISGKLALDLHKVELAPLIDEAVDNVRRAAEEKGVALHTELDPQVGPLLGDHDRLIQVVGNLLSNAVKFTPPGGRVDVTLARQQDEAQASIEVRDTGQGIVPAFLPFVFDRFRQADASMTRAHGGLGLGLSIVRHLVEVHGGTISVASEGEGQGTSFTVRLPLLRASVNGAGSGCTDADELFSAASRLAGRHVLVVEDESDTRAALSALLEQEGAQVTAVGSAAEALAALDRAAPDVLVSDIGMPGEDGYSLLRRVRARSPERGGGVPAVAVTAYAGNDDRRRAISAGFQSHVAKPVDPAALVDAVASLTGFA